jgi:hypothetical protein
MCLIQISTLLLACLASLPAWAQEFSAEALLGQWEFAAYAEANSPEERIPVGVLFEFRPGGVLVTKRSTGDVESRYSVDGETVTYADARGEQTWKVREFAPNASIVIENRGTLMYLERR